MDLYELRKVAQKIAIVYRSKDNPEKPRGVEQYMSGMVGDVGDLQKLLMAKSGYRHKDNIDVGLAHELGDILRSLLMISNELNIDLEKAFLNTMDELEQRLQ